MAVYCGRMTQPEPVRRAGSPVSPAATVVLADLVPGTRAYVDTHRGAPPILVIESGATEVQFGASGGRVTLDDLRAIDTVLEAAAVYRAALLAHLD